MNFILVIHYNPCAMKNIVGLLLLFLIQVTGIFAQVGVNNDNSPPDPSAGLDVKFINKGFLPPRITSLQRNGIVSPAAGLLIYNTDCNDMQYYNGSGWVPLGNTGMLTTPGSIIGNTAPCSNSTGNVYSISPVANATGYHWAVPPGAIITAGQGTQAITVTFGGTSGVICVAAYNECYRSAMSCAAIALIPSLPSSVSIEASGNYCSGNLVTFTATPVNGGSNPAYQWVKNSFFIPGATNSSYSYVPENNDVILCMLFTSAACATVSGAFSNLIVLSIIPSLPVSLTIAASANPVCSGNSVLFTATPFNPGPNPAYQWKKNGTDVSGATNTTYSYTPANNDLITCVLTSNAPCATENPATSNGITMTVNPYDPVSVSITAAAHPQCSNSTYSFTANPANGGTNSLYQWSRDGVNVTGATNASFSTQTLGTLACQMISNAVCYSGSTTVSGSLIAGDCEVVCYGQPINLYCTLPGCENAGATFSWRNSSGSWTSGTRDPVINSGATGYASDVFYLTVNYSPPAASVSKGVYYKEVLPQGTFCCGSTLNISHIAGSVAPVSKTVAYGTVKNVPGEASKCWITSNLGASHQATAKDDNTEASAGWYWQFNRKQGYKHDGTNRTPNTAWITTITENLDWQFSNDPCNYELGNGWRMPTFSEWNNVDEAGPWTTWTGPWISGLKLHAAGYLYDLDGHLTARGLFGSYWSSQQIDNAHGFYLYFSSSNSLTSYISKADGFSLRCIRDF